MVAGVKESVKEQITEAISIKKNNKKHPSYVAKLLQITNKLNCTFPTSSKSILHDMTLEQQRNKSLDSPL